MSRVADLLAAYGASQAEAARQKGQIWGQALSQIGQIPQQIQQQKRVDALTLLEQAREARARGEEQRANALLQAADRKAANTKAIHAVVFANPDQPDIKGGIAKAVELGEDPAEVYALGEKMAPKVGNAPPGSMARYETGPQAGQTVPGSLVPEKPPAPSEASIAMAAAKGDPDAIKALGLIKDKQPASEWGAYTQTFAGLKGKPTWNDLTPDEQKQGFAAFTNLKADPAAQRQWTAIAQQNALQQRQQTFTEQQAGRKELTDKVVAPYQTAQGAVNTLREVVGQAQAGNKVAGSLQNLTTAMTAVGAEGFRRFNMGEVGLVGSAGSWMDRIEGWIGKGAEGQPVPADIQRDMLQLADALERSAYKKYAAGHADIKQRYGLTEQPVPPPDSMKVSTPDLTGLAPGRKRTFQEGPFAGQTWAIGAGGQPIRVP